MSLSPEDEALILRLHYAEHWPVGTIVAQHGFHEESVRRVLGLLLARPSLVRGPSVVDSFDDFIAKTLKDYPRLRATRLFDMVRDRGYAGSVRTLRRYVATVRPTGPHEAFLRLETLVGEQAQVDWAQVGELSVPGGTRPVWAFIMVLSWSRAMWAELVFDQTVPSLCRSLVRACTYFGGSTRQWLFDNPRTIVLGRHGDAARFQPALLKLCGRFFVQPRLCAVRRPQQKGRVERSVRYLRDRFFAGRTLTSIEQGNADLLRFFGEVAHARPHPTQHGRTVADCLHEERQKLLALPDPLPPTEMSEPCTVDKTAFIRFDRNDYSVPLIHAEQVLTLVADDHLVRLVQGLDREVARHPRCWGKHQRVVIREHHRPLIERRRAAQPAKGLERLQSEVPSAEPLPARWVEMGFNVAHQITRTLRLLDLYGSEMLGQAVEDALSRQVFDVGALAQLCEQARRKKKAPTPVEVRLGEHVNDRDVIPHPLSRYDPDE